MWGAILKLLGVDPVGKIIDGIARLNEAKLKAQNDHERLVCDMQIKTLEAELEARRGAKEIRLATAGFWEMRLITFLIAAPFTLHAAAVGLDTTFGFGWGIAAYPKPFDEWEGRILLSFFGLQGATIGVMGLTRVFKK